MTSSYSFHATESDYLRCVFTVEPYGAARQRHWPDSQLLRRSCSKAGVLLGHSDIVLIMLPNRSVANHAQTSLDDVATVAQDLATSGRGLATSPEDLAIEQPRTPKGIEQETFKIMLKNLPIIMWRNCSGAMVTNIRSILAMWLISLVLNRLPLQRHYGSSVNWE